MHYQTIALELLQQSPKLHAQLRSRWLLLTAMETCARELKAGHDTCTRKLSTSRPELDPLQRSNRALELAIEGLRERLQRVSPPSEAEPLSLDEGIRFLRELMPPA